jgi:hypothetical protein
MTALLVTAALAGGAGVAVDLPPATALALEVARAVGATVTRIAVIPDDSLTTGERAAIDAAFARTELFLLVEPARAAAVVKIVRVDPTTLVATVTGAQGEALWTGRSAWPAEPAAAPRRERIATAGPAAEEERRLALEQFARQRLRVAVQAQSHFGLPAILGDDPSPTKLWQGDPAARAARWGAGRPHGGTAVLREQWEIVRGTANLIADMELAELLDDRQLAERIEAARFWPRLFWVAEVVDLPAFAAERARHREGTELRSAPVLAHLA